MKVVTVETVRDLFALNHLISNLAPTAYEYVIKTGGLETWSDYPYTGNSQIILRI